MVIGVYIHDQVYQYIVVKDVESMLLYPSSIKIHLYLSHAIIVNGISEDLVINVDETGVHYLMELCSK